MTAAVAEVGIPITACGKCTPCVLKRTTCQLCDVCFDSLETNDTIPLSAYPKEDWSLMSTLFRAIQRRKYRLAERLVAAGADINASSHSVGNALSSFALELDFLSVQETLNRFKADPNARVAFGTEIVSVLEHFVRRCYTKGGTRTHRVAEMLSTLVAAGARMDGASAKTLMHVDKVLFDLSFEIGAYSRLPDADELQKMLNFACSTTAIDAAIISSLVRLGADPNRTLDGYRRPVHMAMQAKNFDALSVLCREGGRYVASADETSVITSIVDATHNVGSITKGLYLWHARVCVLERVGISFVGLDFGNHVFKLFNTFRDVCNSERNSKRASECFENIMHVLVRNGMTMSPSFVDSLFLWNRGSSEDYRLLTMETMLKFGFMPDFTNSQLSELADDELYTILLAGPSAGSDIRSWALQKEKAVPTDDDVADFRAGQVEALADCHLERLMVDYVLGLLGLNLPVLVVLVICEFVCDRRLEYLTYHRQWSVAMWAKRRWQRRRAANPVAHFIQKHWPAKK